MIVMLVASLECPSFSVLVTMRVCVCVCMCVYVCMSVCLEACVCFVKKVGHVILHQESRFKGNKQ